MKHSDRSGNHRDQRDHRASKDRKGWGIAWRANLTPVHCVPPVELDGTSHVSTPRTPILQIAPALSTSNKVSSRAWKASGCVCGSNSWYRKSVNSQSADQAGFRSFRYGSQLSHVNADRERFAGACAKCVGVVTGKSGNCWLSSNESALVPDCQKR